MVAFVPKGRGAIALGDPVGPPDDFADTVRGFQQFCRANDWSPGFYQTLPDHLDIYRHLGMRAIKIGEEAIVDLRSFSTKGRTGQDFRSALNKLTKSGHHVDFHAPPLEPALLQELRQISEEWLAIMHGSEKRFSVGWFDEAYLADCEIAVVRDSGGVISAFANLVPEYQLNEITIDLMRHRRSMVHGTMDFLFVSLFQHYRDRGYDGFNLGLSALSGVGESRASSRIEKAGHYLYQHLNGFYNFKGLHAYKEKFRPRWEPRYLVFPAYGGLMDSVIALIRADSGDRLIDYLKPGA